MSRQRRLGTRCKGVIPAAAANGCRPMVVTSAMWWRSRLLTCFPEYTVCANPRVRGVSHDGRISFQ